MGNSAQVVPNEPKTLGERLKKRRLELHLFQKDVAKLIGTDTATIQNWERGSVSRRAGLSHGSFGFSVLQSGRYSALASHR